MSKHTPGPWEYCENSWSTISIIGANQITVCVLETDIADDLEMRADARLIAAAPLMYEALEEIMQAIDKEYGPRAANFPKARAALQAAKGGDSDGSV